MEKRLVVEDRTVALGRGPIEYSAIQQLVNRSIEIKNEALSVSKAKLKEPCKKS